MNIMDTPSSSSRRFAHSAFTLVELLVVIAIIGVLAAIVVPVVGNIRHGANSSKSVSNLRQIGNAVVVYTTANVGSLPLLNRRASNPDSNTQFFWPQALEEVVFEWDRNDLGKHEVFTDPTAASSHAISDYGGSTYVFLDANSNNPNRSERPINLQQLQDPVNTLLVCTSYAEKTGKASWYVQGEFGKGSRPNNIPEARLGSGEVGVVFGDGHVELISENRMYDDLDYRQSIFDITPN